jgi:hypothetical protein
LRNILYTRKRIATRLLLKKFQKHGLLAGKSVPFRAETLDEGKASCFFCGIFGSDQRIECTWVRRQ